MKKVRFLKPWRGHVKDAVDELTDERATELIALNICTTKLPGAAVAKVKATAAPRRRRPHQVIE